MVFKSDPRKGLSTDRLCELVGGRIKCGSYCQKCRSRFRLGWGIAMKVWSDLSLRFHYPVKTYADGILACFGKDKSRDTYICHYDRSKTGNSKQALMCFCLPMYQCEICFVSRDQTDQIYAGERSKSLPPRFAK